MTLGPPVTRCDRMDVPTTLDTGARRLPVVLARVGVLRYAWGNERVDAASLADPAFAEACAGIPVMVGVDDLEHPQRVEVGDDGGTVRAGTLLSARFDAAQGALVGELVVDTPEGLAAVARGVRGVSLGYKADCIPTAPEDRADGATHVRTRMYAPNHLILTLVPRGGPSVAVRADGGSMEMSPEALTSFSTRLDGYDAQFKEMGARMDALDGKVGEALKKWAAQEASKPEHRADAAPVQTAGVWRAVLAAAAAHKVEIADSSTLLDAQRQIGAKLVGKERADALDGAALDAVIAAGAVRQGSAGPTLADWQRQIKSAANANAPQPGADRGDAASDTTALLGRI